MNYHFGDTGAHAKSNNIIPDISRLDYPQDVKIEADKIWKKNMKTTKKGRARKQFLFACVYQAHLDMGIREDPKNIAERVGLEEGSMSKALTMISPCGKTNITNAIDLIPGYAQTAKLDASLIPQIVELGKTIIELDKKQNNKDPLSEKYPQRVAAAILLYYMTTNGIRVDKKIFATQMKLSEVTISSTYKDVIIIHNN